jgi:hypothetical protein
MNMSLKGFSWIAAAALCVLPSAGLSANPDASAPAHRLTFTLLPFPTKATFKHWTSSVGSVVVCRTKCGGNGGSESPYEDTALYGSRYTSIAYGSSATFVLKRPVRAVAFIWGSLDPNCNVARFYDTAGVRIGKITADELPSAGYYEIQSSTRIGSIVFHEKPCTGDVFFEIANGPFPYKADPGQR